MNLPQFMNIEKPHRKPACPICNHKLWNARDRRYFVCPRCHAVYELHNFKVVNMAEIEIQLDVEAVEGKVEHPPRAKG